MVSIGIGSTVAAHTHLPTQPDKEKGEKNKQTNIAFMLISISINTTIVRHLPIFYDLNF